MVFVHVVTAVTDISLTDMLHLMISCLTGIGAVVVGALLFMVYAWGVMWLREYKAKHTKPPAVDWEAILEEVQK